MALHEVDIKSLSFNPFTKIAREWMLVTAGTENRLNTMTASWGALGEFWGHEAVTCYIRASRYTKEFLDANDLFTLSFFDEAQRKALNLCGSVSGRDCDKVAQAGLTPMMVDGAPAFEEADMVFVCRKVYVGDMPKNNFIDPEADARWYADGNYHTMYIGAIEKALVRA